MSDTHVTTPRTYLRGLKHPRQRAYLEAYVAAVIAGSESPLADACHAVGIWRGTPARWREQSRFATAEAKAARIAFTVRGEIISRRIRERLHQENPVLCKAVYGH